LGDQTAFLLCREVSPPNIGGYDERHRVGDLSLDGPHANPELLAREITAAAIQNLAPAERHGLSLAMLFDVCY